MTVGGLSSGTTTGAKLITSSVAGAVSFTVRNDVATTNSDYTFGGSIQNGSGTMSFIKDGSRTLTLTGANTYTGSTTVNGGKLVAGGANALQNTSSITVNSGTLEASVANAVTASGTITVNSAGTLLLSGAGNLDRISNAAPLTLAGGQIVRGAGASEGVAGSSSGGATVAGLGVLTLSANSHVDFGTGAVGSLVFASLNGLGFSLFIDHWAGVVGMEGTAATDRLIFAQALSAADLANVSFTGFTGPAIQISLSGGAVELEPGLVPEASTWVAGILTSLVFLFAFVRSRRSRSLERI